MSNFSIDALLGKVTLNKNRQKDTKSCNTENDPEKSFESIYKRSRLSIEVDEEHTGDRLQEDDTGSSSESDVFSEKDCETVKCKSLYFFKTFDFLFFFHCVSLLNLVVYHFLFS